MTTTNTENTTPVAVPEKVGDEFLVDATISKNYVDLTATTLTNGGFVVSWVSANGLGGAAQLFDADGARIGSSFAVNTTPTGGHFNPTITGLDNGGFVVAWQDNSGLGGDSAISSIKAQVFDATGDKVGGEFLVNTTTVGSQFAPTITCLTGGGFVVGWVDGSEMGGDSSVYSIKAQVFDATGDKVGGEFLVNTTTESAQNFPSITGLPGGGFVVTWNDRSGLGGDSLGWSVKAQVFDAAGAKVGGEFLVNTTTVDSQFVPTITGLSGGGFVVGWEDGSGLGGDSYWSIKAQVFDAAGAKVGGEFLVNTTTESSQGSPKITGLNNGGFVVAWGDRSELGGDNSNTSVKAQVFDATGDKVGGEFLVNTTTEGDQWGPTITGLNNGNFVIAWVNEDNSQNTSINAQMFGVNDSAPVITTAATQTVAENTKIVAVLTSTDADTVGTNPAIFSIIGGADETLFDIVGGNLVFKTAPDYETDPHSYQVEVSAFDGVNTAAQMITINLNDVNEAPTAVTLANTTASIFENTSTATHIKVADITVTDDALGTNTLVLTGPDAAAFEIVGNALYLKAGTVLDFESKTSYAVAVTVDDPTVDGTPDATSTMYTLAVANISGVVINGTTGKDTIDATTTVAGQPFPTNEEDTVNGGSGNDTINVFGGNDLINGGSGSDRMLGGTGSDTYVVDHTGDVVVENANEGTDTVQTSITYALGVNVENLTLTGTSKINGTGNALANVIIGNSGNNVLAGLGGADTLTGGEGADKFVVEVLADSLPATPDIITDFLHGIDRIDFSAIDANTSKGGNQAFAYAGENDHVVAHSVTWFESDGHTIVQADVNGNTTPDLMFVLTGINHNLTASDFIL